MPKSEERQKMQPDLDALWGFVKYRHLILATPNFIVFIDDELDLDWKTTDKYDEANLDKQIHWAKILNRAAAIEAAEWDTSSEQRTINFKRQIGEAIARGFDCQFEQADEMLLLAEQRRLEELQRRKDAIREQIMVKDQWLKCRKTWTTVHYSIGIAALFFASLAASKTEALGLTPTITAWCAWLTVLCTALLTFLSAERKSNKYTRAWSILNNQIARYNADYQVQLKDVLESYTRGENIIFDTDPSSNKRLR